MGVLVLVLFLATLLSSSYADFNSDNPIKMKGRRSATVGADPKINCLSFRYGVEAYNLRDWATVPSSCKSSLKSYMTGKQYGLDIEGVMGAAIKYMMQSGRAKDFDAWIFDVEDTLLTNKNYFKSSKFEYGTIPLNITSYYGYLKNSTGVELHTMRDLYNIVLAYGYKIFLISEAPESFRNDMEKLLKSPGYKHYELILKEENDNAKSAALYKTEKRSQLAANGWNIVGNVGDQWSDLIGANNGARTFKIPNPFYYVA